MNVTVKYRENILQAFSERLPPGAKLSIVCHVTTVVDVVFVCDSQSLQTYSVGKLAVCGGMLCKMAWNEQT